MKLLTFSGRNAKEILRDPLTAFFGLGFPIVLLLLLSAIQANIPVSLFELKSLAPGMTVFGLSFMTLFSATLIARDRESTFLQRLYTSPLTAADFIFGYALPILPIALAQCLLCYVTALIMGLPATVNILYAALCILPVALFFIALVFVNVYRFTIQGLGFSGFAVFAGVFEMVARAFMGFVMVPVLGYPAVCLSSPLAWIFADIFLVPAFGHCIKKLQKQFGEEGRQAVLQAKLVH